MDNVIELRGTGFAILIPPTATHASVLTQHIRSASRSRKLKNRSLSCLAFSYSRK